MENTDLAPYLIARGRWGYRMGDGQLYDSMQRHRRGRVMEGYVVIDPPPRAGPQILPPKPSKSGAHRARAT